MERDFNFGDDGIKGNNDLGSDDRPPLYNPEDYVSGLRRFSKLTGLQLYVSNSLHSAEHDNNNKVKGGGKVKNDDDDDDNEEEMGLRQFRTISELLSKLKSDLSASFASFQREFVSYEPSSGSGNDGVTSLLAALKAVQLAQTNISGSLNQLGSRANHVMLKRALADEYETLLCLKIICGRNEEGAHRLADHPSGLFTVAVCVMSNYSKSRVLSLQLLAKLCDVAGGHKQVSDAISMLRVRFGEPVRFKFLVGMLNSYNSCLFQVACLRFFNKFIETSKDSRERIMIQTELEEAGLSVAAVTRRMNAERRANNRRGSSGRMMDGQDDKCDLSMLLEEEIDRWEENYIDINSLVKKLLTAERENRRLREEITKMKRAKVAAAAAEVASKKKQEKANKQQQQQNTTRNEEHLESSIDNNTEEVRVNSRSNNNKAKNEDHADDKDDDVDDGDDHVVVNDPTKFDDQCDREFSETCFVSDDVMLLLPSGTKKGNNKSKNDLKNIDKNETVHVRTTSDNVNSVEIISSTPNSESSNGKDSDGKTRPPHPKPRRQDKASQADGRKSGKLSLMVKHSGISADSGLSSEDSHDRLERRKKAKEAIRRNQAEEKDSNQAIVMRASNSQTTLPIRAAGRSDRLSSEEPSPRDHRRIRNNIRRTKSFHITSELEKPSKNEGSLWKLGSGGKSDQKQQKPFFAFGDTVDRQKSKAFSKSSDFTKFLSRRSKRKEAKNSSSNVNDPTDIIDGGDMRERRSSSANNSNNSGSNNNKNHNSLFEMWEQRCNSEMTPEQRQQQQKQQQQHSSRSPQRKPIFPDWRQDTPFWNKQVCPVKPNPKASSGHRRFFEDHNAARAYEEPWFYYQQYAAAPPPPPQMVEQRQPARYKHPVNGGNGYMFVSSSHGGGDPAMYLPTPAFPPHHAYHVEYPFVPRTTRTPDRRSVSSGSSGGGGGGGRRMAGRSPFRNEFRLEITELEDEEEKVDSDAAAESDFEEEFPDGEAIRYDDPGRKPARGMEAQSHILDFPSGIY